MGAAPKIIVPERRIFIPRRTIRGTIAKIYRRPQAGAGGGGGNTLTDSQSATVSGSGFGSTGPTLRLWHNFNEGTNGSAISANAPQVGAYDSVTLVNYSNSSPKEGSLCALAAPNAANEFRNLAINMHSGDGIKGYFAAWVAVNGGQFGQKKIFEWFGNPYTGNYAPGGGCADVDGVGAICWYSREDIDYVNQSGQDSLATSWTEWPNGVFDDSGNVWHFMEFIHQQNSAGGAADGRVTIRVNGTNLFNAINRNTRRDGTRQWDYIAWIDGHTKGGSTSVTYCQYRTDLVYFQNGWARVLAHNASTLGASSIVVPQLVNSWAGTSISITGVKGPLSSGAIYLSVVDNSDTTIATQSWTLT